MALKALSVLRSVSKVRVMVVAGLCAAAGLCGQAQGGDTPFTTVPVVGSVPSQGLFAGAVSSGFTLNRAPTWIRVRGTLRETAPATFASEAGFLFVDPTGKRYVARPIAVDGFTTTVNVPMDACLVTTGSAGGAWTVNVFENFKDAAGNTPDATWENLAFEFYDSTPPRNAVLAPTADGPSVTTQSFDVQSSGVQPSANFFVPGVVATNRVRVRGVITDATGWTSGSGASAAPIQSVQLRLRALDVNLQQVEFVVDPTPGVGPFASSHQFDTTVDLPTAVLGSIGNTWTITPELITPLPATPAPGILARVEVSVQPFRATPPTPSGSFVIRSRRSTASPADAVVWDPRAPVPAGQVRWFVFTTEQLVSNSAGTFLDINSQLVSGGPTDHELAVYDSDGILIATDDDAGPGNRAQLSFGQTSPARSALLDEGGTGDARNGANGSFAAGSYYLAVGAFNMNPSPALFAVTSNSAAGGSIRVEFRTNLPPAPFPTSQDLGVARGPVTQSTGTFVISDTNIQWFTFNLPVDASQDNGRFLDIVVNELEGPSGAEAGMVLFGANGRFEKEDLSPSANDGTTLISLGSNVARPALQPSGRARIGQNGNLASGQYYLAVGGDPMTFDPLRDFAPGGMSLEGSLVFNVSLLSNLPSRCGMADVGSQGGITGPDNRLDNNDFAAFISLFFNGNLIADVGQQGGSSGSDGQLNNNDFAAFITAFFNPPSTCAP